MATRTVMEGNAFYEVDESCLAQKEKKRERGGNGRQEEHESRRENGTADTDPSFQKKKMK